MRSDLACVSDEPEVPVRLTFPVESVSIVRES
jgi:hypothetical protein